MLKKSFTTVRLILLTLLFTITIHFIFTVQATEEQGYNYIHEKFAKFPYFYIYRDYRSPENNGEPSGWMGDWEDLIFKDEWEENPRSGTSCIRIDYSGKAQQGEWWAGIYWVAPSKVNWWERGGSFNLTRAKRVTFSVRGQTGREKVEFKVGGIDGDSIRSPISTGLMTLSKQWKTYTIPLPSNVGHLKGLFLFVLNVDNNPERPTIFFLDEIRYEYDQDEPKLRLLESYDTDEENPDYDTVDRFLKDAAYTYDNSLALLSALERGMEEYLRLARHIGDSFLYAMENDPYFKDNRLRNGYHASNLAGVDGKAWYWNGPWDEENDREVGDAFGAGTYTGNVGWAMIALIRLYEATGEYKYLDAAEKLGEWIETNCRADDDLAGYTGGFGGWEPGPTNAEGQKKMTWKSTEHNLVLLSAFSLLYRATKEEIWLQSVLHARRFVDKMWAGDHFWIGTKENGMINRDEEQAFDIQAYGLFVLGEKEKYGAALGWAEENFYFSDVEYEGFDFNRDKDGIFFEAVGQAVLAFKQLGDSEKADRFLKELEKAQSDTGGIFAASKDKLTTGQFDPVSKDPDTGKNIEIYVYSRLNLAATCWYLFATHQSNPFYTQLPLKVTVTGSPATGEGDKIVVELQAESGGQAKFFLESISTPVVMTERETGKYSGEYIAKLGDKNESATVIFTNKDGNVGTKSIEVIIDASLKVTVTGSPAQKAGDKIIVKLVAETGGQAKFFLESISESVVMTERETGNYVGEYTAKFGDKNESATVTFTDKSGNVITKSIEVIIDVPLDITSLFSVDGTVYEDGIPARNGLTVEVKNLTAKRSERDVTGAKAGDSRYVVTFMDMESNRAAKVGDELEVRVINEKGELLGIKNYQVKPEDIQAGKVTIDIDIGEKFTEFTLSLATGLNLISVPLNPGVSWRLSDLLDFIGKEATMVICYDTEQKKFITFMPNFPKDAKTNVAVSGDKGYILMMSKPKNVTFKGTAWNGKVSFVSGLNMISVPLNPEKLWKLSDLLDFIGKEATMVIYYDTEQEKFITFMSNFPKDAKANVAVEGGAGYIVQMKAYREAIFEGTPWQNTAPVLAPDVITQRPDFITRTSVLVVEGDVLSSSGDLSPNRIQVRMQNMNTRLATTAEPGDGAGLSRYVATFVSLTDKPAASLGDILEINAYDATGAFSAAPLTYTITAADIRHGRVVLPSLILSPIPEKSALLQNYPNPFNPETWIPYQLAEASDVTIRIYNVAGQLVRTIALGHKEAGIYLSSKRAAYWDGRNDMGEEVASGVYFYSMQAGKFTGTRRLVIQK